MIKSIFPGKYMAPIPEFDDKLDAIRYAQVYGSMPEVTKVQPEPKPELITDYVYSVCSDDFDVGIEINGEHFVSVPKYAMPRIECILVSYLHTPDTLENRRKLKNEIHETLLELTYGPKISHLQVEIKFDEGAKEMIIPEIKKVIYSGSKTIIIWADNTKTITSCAEGEQYDEYYGFCSAVVKKLFGSTTAAKKAIKKARVENKNKKGDVNGCKNSCV